MSTRSEVRVHINGKQKACVYHHMDGYPSHMINDIATIGGSRNIKSMLKGISKAHGTGDVRCASGDKGRTHQGDIDYAYDVYMKKERKIRGYAPSPKITKVKISKINYDWKTNKITKVKEFSGDIHKAYSKYVCEKGR